MYLGYHVCSSYRNRSYSINYRKWSIKNLWFAVSISGAAMQTEIKWRNEMRFIDRCCARVRDEHETTFKIQWTHRARESHIQSKIRSTNIRFIMCVQLHVAQTRDLLFAAGVHFGRLFFCCCFGCVVTRMHKFCQNECTNFISYWRNEGVGMIYVPWTTSAMTLCRWRCRDGVSKWWLMALLLPWLDNVFSRTDENFVWLWPWVDELVPMNTLKWVSVFH